MGMIERKTWDEFRGIGLLWWVNRILHIMGWVIVVDTDDQDRVTDIYPARTLFRGMSDETEEKGHIALSTWLANMGPRLRAEAAEEVTTF